MAGTLGFGVNISTTNAGQGWFDNANTGRPLTISGGRMTGNGGTTPPETVYQIVANNKSLTGNAFFRRQVVTANGGVTWAIYGVNGSASAVNTALNNQNFDTNAVAVTAPASPIVRLANGTFGSVGTNISTTVNFGTGYDYVIIAISTGTSVSASSFSIDNLTLSK